MLERFPTINNRQAVLHEELAAIMQKQISVDENLETLSCTLQSVESEMVASTPLRAEVEDLKASSEVRLCV